VQIHIDAFHGVGRGEFLEVAFDVLEGEYAGEEAEREDTTKDRTHGIQESNGEVGYLHDGDHFKDYEFTSSKDN